MRDGEISRVTGVPRSTISAWRHGRGCNWHRKLATACGDWRPVDEPAYAYLLGMYLGDGCLSVGRLGSASLLVSLDTGYPQVVEEAGAAMAALFAGSPLRRAYHATARVVVLKVSHPALPYAFPQHGPGHKHKRPIELTEWQQRITRAHPESLIRGLIHSDGCRCLNRFKVKLPSGRVAEYEYPRYFFSNLSEDIRRIFCEHCELLGIRWTQSNPRNISVSHRRSVARLDEFVGPKR